ncbi:MAG: hypothetical protein CTY25_08810 [Methylobacterium sp.]|nr:MAG: hypothetical protein CTY25_08810 [Methylobacterium sp.]
MESDLPQTSGRPSKISYSQNFEDVYIDRVFSDVEKGFYVDLGAYHPSFDSVTKYFYCKGWRGVNVEPGPNFDEFITRDRDINLKVAIAQTSEPRAFIFNPLLPGTSLVADFSLVASEPEANVEKVQCMTLDYLFENVIAGEHVHFLKIDIEGGEDAVIKSTDWQKIRPELLLIESVLPMTNHRCDENWRPHLIESGYHEVFFDGINVYYLRQESLFRAKELNRPCNVLDGFTKYGYADYQLEQMNKHYEWLQGRFKDAEIAIADTKKDLSWLQDRYAELVDHSEVVGRHRDAHDAWMRDLLRRAEEDRDAKINEIKQLQKTVEQLRGDLERLQLQKVGNRKLSRLWPFWPKRPP